MIENLYSINFIRNFIGFDSKLDFKKKNVIYAPNGSGKTNLSRLLLSIKKQDSLDELKSQEAFIHDIPSFEIKTSAGIISNENYQSGSEFVKYLQVFNSDYIDDVIRIENFSRNDVTGKIEISIGKESNVIAEIEKKIHDTNALQSQLYEDLKKKHNTTIDDKLDSSGFTKRHLSIWSNFQLSNIISNTYDISIPKKLTSFQSCEPNLSQLIDIDENRTLHNNNPIKLRFDNINYDDLKLQLLEPKQFQVADKNTQIILKEITRDWIESNEIKKGVEESRRKGKCILCQRVLNDDVSKLFHNYELYFKNAESKFRDKLKTIKRQLEHKLVEISNLNNDLEFEVSSMCSLLNIEEKWSRIDISKLKSRFNSIIASIDNKLENPSLNTLQESGISNIELVQDSFLGLNKSLQQNDELITKINQKLSDSGRRKTELRTQVGKKWLYEFYQSNESQISKLKNSSDELAVLEESLEKEKEKLPDSNVLPNIIKVANHFLHKFLSLTKYSFDESAEKIVIKLNDTDISTDTKQKISEGEKTMIALCFFLSSSVRELNSIEDYKKAIFVIDDPVNSTSYNYLFGIGFLLKSFDQELATLIWPKEDFQLRNQIQKIILTHNTPLFNLLKTQVFKTPSKKINGVNTPINGYFLLSDRNLTEIYGQRLKSEFETCLQAIKNAFNSASDELRIGNDIRRVFETIKHFYGMDGDFNAEWLKKVFSNFNQVDHTIFFAVINYYSHGNPEAHEDPLYPGNIRTFLIQFDELIKNSNFSELWARLD